MKVFLDTKKKDFNLSSVPVYTVDEFMSIL